MVARLRFSFLFVALVIAAGIWAMATTQLSTSFLPVLPQHLPSVRGLTEFSQLAVGEDNIYLVTDPKLPEADAAQLLTRVRPKLAAADGVGQIGFPGEQLFGNAGAFAAWLLIHSPVEVFQKAVGVFDPQKAKARLEQIPGQLAGAVDAEEIMRLQLDPLGILETLGSGEAPAMFAKTAPRLLVITPSSPLGDAQADMTFVDTLEQVLAQELDPTERTHLLLTGTPVFNAEITRQMRKDMLIMVATGIVLLLGAFYLFYRTLQPLRWILFFQLVTMLCGILGARLLFGSLNVISIGFASILLGVGMDYYILVYHHFASPHREDHEVWKTLCRGIWFSAGVTAASFFLLGFSSFPGLRQLALLVGLGLLATALFATWQLRLILKTRPPHAPQVLFKASDSLASWILRWKHLLLVLLAAILGTVCWLRPWQKVSDFYEPDMNTLKPVGVGAFVGSQWLEQLDPSAKDAVYVLRAKSHDALRELAPKLAQKVSAATAPATWMIPSETNRAANLAAWNAGTATTLRNLFADSGLEGEWSASTLQLADTLTAAAQGDTQAFAPIAPILATFAGEDPRGAYAIFRIPGAATKPVPDDGYSWADPGVEISPVSWVSLASEVTAMAQNDCVALGGAMLGAIVLLCAAAQRSLRMVALNLIALLLSFCIFYGLLRLSGTKLSPMSLMSVPLLVGLVIDYSLHLLIGLNHQKGNLHHAYNHLAAPILLTALSSCIGFGAPMLTGQPALRNFGIVMDLGIISAILACLILLPPIYLLGRGGDYRNRLFYRTLYSRRGLELVLFAWRLLGRPAAWLISRTLGLGYAFTHPATVRAVRDNISLLDPGQATFLKACSLFVNQAEEFSNFGRIAMQPGGDLMHLVGERTGFEHLQRAQQSGKGCLLVTGHLGFFELGGLVMSQLGFPMTALTLPEPSSELTQWRADFRARWGVKTAVVGKDTFSFLEIVKTIQGGGFVASLADRPFDENSTPVPFPHGYVPFSNGPTLLALLAGCPIVPVGITRAKDGKFRIEACAYLEPRWLPAGREATLGFYTRQIAEALLPMLVRNPEQWYQFSPLRIPAPADSK